MAYNLKREADNAIWGTFETEEEAEVAQREAARNEASGKWPEGRDTGFYDVDEEEQEQMIEKALTQYYVEEDK